MGMTGEADGDGAAMSDSPSASSRSVGRGPVEARSVGSRPVELPPLSYAQQRHWFLDQIAPGKAFANVARAFRIRGWLDVEALLRAVETIRERHEVLRSVFRFADGHLVQAVAGHPGPSLPVIDLIGWAEEARGAEALRLAEEEAREPFDLAQGPLLRAALVRLNAEEHVLVVVVHQAVFDERSSEIFDQELGALYEAFHSGLPSPLPQLPIQYADFAIWQRDWLSSGAVESQLSYWKRQLEGAPGVLRLPSSRRRSEGPTFRGATETASLGPEMTEGLRAFSDRHGATLFMTLLAAFQALLRLHSGRGDVAVGSPMEGRHWSGTEGLIGPFANTIVFRSNLSGDPTFLEVLRRVRDAVVQAEAHQDLPFEKLVEELNPERTLKHPPLFQVTLDLKTRPEAPLRLAGLSVSPLPLAAEIARYDLALSFFETKGELSASLLYAADLYDTRSIRRMIAHLEVLLGGILQDPDRPLSQLPLMAPGERHQLLVEWNQTAVEYPSGASVVRLFERQAERTPSAPAVEFEGRILTYRELNRRSNRLARFLRGSSVGPEALVGIAVRRSPDMLVALLGVLKAGGAYMPLDPAYPVERLRHVLEDSGASLVLADRGAVPSLPKGLVRVLVLDDLSKSIAAESAEDLPAVATPGNLVYVIYTSGSTGRPKGVEIEHRSLSNYIEYAADLFGLRAGDRVLQFASLSFDTAAEEVFCTLVRGATLVLRAEEMIASVEGFLETCRDQRITVLDLPTSYWHQVAAVASAEGLRLPEYLRLVALGGERALPERLAQWRGVPGAGRVRLLNAYGPSEATIAATCWEAGEEVPPNLANVPIGRPVANTRTYVLDVNLQPLPIGVVGELYIGGVGLARGYRNRPDLTAAAFLPDPFIQNERIYRTGDRARYGPEGDLEYMGRVDGQIKLRGIRIEPGDVEAALLGHPDVEEAVVVLRGDEPNQRLVAYLVPKRDRNPSWGDMRAVLRKALPDPLIPSAFVTLAALPLTPSRKVDRQRLPEPDSDRVGIVKSHVAPRDLVELKLARIWQKVLGVDRVGVEDDFFELRGHSLLAAMLLFEIERAFGRRLPLTVIFDAPTVGQLASLLREEGWSPSWQSLVPIQEGGSRRPLFLVHALGGNVLTYRHLARRLGSEQPVYALQAQGLDGSQPPLRRVEDMASQYVAAIREVQPEGPYCVSGHSFGGTVAFEMARQLTAAGQRVSLVALIDADNIPDAPPPSGARAARGWRHFKERILFHMGAMKRLDVRAIAAYAAEKTGVVLGWMARKLKGCYQSIRRARVPEAIRIVNAAHQEASNQYVPGPYGGRVVLFRAFDRRQTNPGNYDLGWAKVCRGGLEIIEVPGHHETLCDEAEVGPLAREFGAILKEGEQGESGAAPAGSQARGPLRSTI